MKRIFVSGTRHKPFPFKACVAAIGVFDGVHRGHQKVIGRAVREARRMGLPSVVITFDPHPAEVLRPQEFKPYIAVLEHRLQLIEALGVDACVVIAFNKIFARKSPGEFVDGFLSDYLHVRKVVVGNDFHFGRGHAGTFAALRSMGCERGFTVEQVDILKLNNINIKSTYIKDLISDGDLTGTRRFLGRPYEFLGEVERGDGRGRRLGFPTANFKKESVIILPSGIYMVNAYLCRAGMVDRAKPYQGLCFIGRRETFKNANARIIQELHLLDVRRNLYGQKIVVQFLKKLRDDKKFIDGNSLVRQIVLDVEKARAFFAGNILR